LEIDANSDLRRIPLCCTSVPGRRIARFVFCGGSVHESVSQRAQPLLTR
jgi:hypothetical protein